MPQIKHKLKRKRTTKKDESNKIYIKDLGIDFYQVSKSDVTIDDLASEKTNPLQLSDEEQLSFLTSSINQSNALIRQREIELAKLLIYATKKSDTALASKIIETEQFNSRVTDEHGRIALHYIAALDQPDITKKLIQKDPESIIIADNSGNNAFHFSTYNDKNANTDILLESAAQQQKTSLIFSKNAKGDTPLNYSESYTLIKAVKSGDTNKVKRQYNEDAIINFQDTEGNTALHYGVKSGNLDIIKFLLEKGASKEVPNNEKKTPADIGNPDLMHSLRLVIERNSQKQLSL